MAWFLLEFFFCIRGNEEKGENHSIIYVRLHSCWFVPFVVIFPLFFPFYSMIN